MSTDYCAKLRPRKRKAPETLDDTVADDHNHNVPRRPRKRRRMSTTSNSSSSPTPNDSNHISSPMHDSNDSNVKISKSLNQKSRRRQSRCHSRDVIKFDVRSWGYFDKGPYKSFIKLSNNETSSGSPKSFDDPKKRGHRIVVIDGISGAVEQTLTLDTWADIYSGIRLRIFLQTLQFKPNKWVIIIVHDSGYNINTKVSLTPFW